MSADKLCTPLLSRASAMTPATDRTVCAGRAPGSTTTVTTAHSGRLTRRTRARTTSSNAAT
ncbi:hypothetical protein [Streptomyces sp. NPDC017524]|uniref:hypothetical protein n=1 Tax=Streptomyces sp. NPDC017524 TaxID=3364999 RepID=UPI00379A426A